jgi:hypothetical protein
MANTKVVVGSKVNATSLESSEDAARRKILEEANDDFKGLYGQVRNLLTSEGIGIIKSRYEIGVLLEEGCDEENKYGSKFIQRMETILGYEKDVIYQSLRFRKRYSEDEVETLLGLRNNAGDPLLWTHIVHLLQATDSVERAKLQQLTLENSWSPPQLLSYIQKKQGGKRNPGGGRPMARPKSLKGFVDQQIAVLDQLLSRKDKVWAGKEKDTDQSFFDLLNNTPWEKIDASVLTELEQLEQRYEKASMELDNMATEILKARKKVERSKIKADEEGEKDDDNTKPTPARVIARKKVKQDLAPALDG